MRYSLTAVLRREGDWYVAHCPELDIASQGDSLEEAKRNLREAVEGFLECAPTDEVAARLQGDVFVSGLEVVVA
jgi:predicted RNase H-like HicB family nuclease